MVLYTLSVIWKNGGVFNILPDGDIELDLRNAKKIPDVVLKTAESIYEDIKIFLSSVDGMDNASKTLWMMITVFCGWQQNEKIKGFLNGDDIALNMFLEWQAKLNGNGWSEIYQDYRQFENEETDKIKQDIFKRAVSFSKPSK